MRLWSLTLIFLLTVSTAARQGYDAAAQSLGPGVTGPTQLVVETPRSELEIYLRVWGVLYPDAEVHVGASGEDEAPAA